MASAMSRNPTGPALEQVAQPGQRVTWRVTRGGSFLCSDLWCKGYQPGARQPFDNESPSNHTGFRCVMDATEPVANINDYTTSGYTTNISNQNLIKIDRFSTSLQNKFFTQVFIEDLIKNLENKYIPLVKPKREKSMQCH